MVIELLLPTPEEVVSVLRGGRTLRGYPLVEGSRPPRVILNQSRYLLTDTALSYRWTVPYFIRCETEIVGSVGGKGLLPGEDTVEIAYNIAPGRRRRGIATAAVGLIVERAVRDGLRPIAHVQPDNVGSQRVLASNGWRRETTLVLPEGTEIERWALSESAPPRP